VEEARKITAPLYDALNQPAKKDVSALLAQATLPDYRSYPTNEEHFSRDQLADVFKKHRRVGPGSALDSSEHPGFRGSNRGARGSDGNAHRRLLGAKSTGKGFKTMAIDVFTVRNGKLASAYHVENWMTALQQIGG
jgi:hypothetical protein